MQSSVLFIFRSGGNHLKVKLLFSALSMGLALIFGELACRAIFPKQVDLKAAEPTGNQYVYYQYDPLLGWSNAPNTRGVYRRREFEYPISINRYGMRDREVSQTPRAGQYRIAVLGDSFTWAIGAADGERFTDLIQNEAGIECLNFGVSGYGPIHYWLSLERVLQFQPDLIIVVFCCENDFWDNVHSKAGPYHKPFAQLRQTPTPAVEITGFPIPNSRQFGRAGPHVGLAAYSLLYRKTCSAVKRVHRYLTDRPPQGLLEFRNVHGYESMLPNERAVVDQAVLINRLIFRDIKRKLDEHSVPLLLIAAPSKLEFPVGRTPDRTVGRLLNQMAADLKIVFIDPIDDFSLDDFWEYDGHWRPAGHLKMARVIKDYLTEMQQLPCRAEPRKNPETKVTESHKHSWENVTDVEAADQTK